MSRCTGGPLEWQACTWNLRRCRIRQADERCADACRSASLQKPCSKSKLVVPLVAALLQARSHEKTARLPQAVEHTLTAGRSACRHMPAWILFYPHKLHDMPSAEGMKL